MEHNDNSCQDIRVTARELRNSQRSTHHTPDPLEIHIWPVLHALFNGINTIPTHRRIDISFKTQLTSSVTSDLKMQTVSHNTQLPYREAKEHSTATAIDDISSALQRFPAELLVRTAAALRRAEDLQNIRLGSRAFSKAATTVLQSRFVRLHLMPIRTSMDRFTSLTMNTLIAPKILQLVVIYSPPLATTVSSECAMIGKSFDMSEHNVKDIVSEFNATCAYSEFNTEA
jgi:hypothetical protein